MCFLVLGCCCKLVVFVHSLLHRPLSSPVSVMRTERLLVRSSTTLGSSAWMNLALLVLYVFLCCCLCFCVHARFLFVTGSICQIRVCSLSSARPRVATLRQEFCLRYWRACTYLLMFLSLCLRLLLQNRRCVRTGHVYRRSLRRGGVWTKRLLRSQCRSCVCFQLFSLCCLFCMFSM